MYHWAKNTVRDMIESRRDYVYKGLVFTRIDELEHPPRPNDSRPRFAFYGQRQFTREQIRYYVDQMIACGEYLPPGRAAA